MIQLVVSVRARSCLRTFLHSGDHIELVVIFIAYSQGSFQYIKSKHTPSVLKCGASVSGMNVINPITELVLRKLPLILLHVRDFTKM